MNMHAKPELLAPCFPMFQVEAESIKAGTDKVSFTLKYGCVEIDCECQANELSDSTWFNKTNDPQNDVEVDYTKLEVDQNTEINVIRHDVNLVEGQKLQLTERQIHELNQQLEWICVELFEKKLEKVA